MFKILLKSCAVLVFTLFIVSCGSGTGTATGSDTTFVIKKATKPTVVLVFGDSVSQGYGTSAYGNVYQQVTPGSTYVELLRQGIQTEKIGELAPVTIINASLGSEFTADAIARLPGLLAQYKPTHVLLAHGTNDAWTDLPNSYISNNFGIMVDMVKNSGAKVFLVDVTFSLYGTEFANAYSNMVLSLAKATGSTYINLLNGVFGNSKYYLGDGVHLNDSAQPIMMKNVWDQLIPTFD